MVYKWTFIGADSQSGTVTLERNSPDELTGLLNLFGLARGVVTGGNTTKHLLDILDDVYWDERNQRNPKVTRRNLEQMRKAFAALGERMPPASELLRRPEE